MTFLDEFIYFEKLVPVCVEDESAVECARQTSGALEEFGNYHML